VNGKKINGKTSKKKFKNRVVGEINALVGWLPFTLAKKRIISHNQNPFFLV
jgi:hypothetical protein